MTAEVVPDPPRGRRRPVALTRAEVREVVVAAVSSVDGVSLLVPLRREALRLTGGGEGLAVTVSEGMVEVRLVAHRLPLPPLLDRAGGLVRVALTGTQWSDVPVRLVVAQLTRDAFDDR